MALLITVIFAASASLGSARFAQRFMSEKLQKAGLVDNPVNHVLALLEQQERKAHKTTVERVPAATLFYDFQLLDHFDSSITKEPVYWRQRYYVDSNSYRPGGPIFVYIGGEGPQGPPSQSLFMHSQAVRYGALEVALEHRFYGESRPVKDMSTENLQYLTSEQALADLARFIDFFQVTYREAYGADTAKWITFGGSYPGALSAWFKLKYPSKVVGAIASSAPVFAEFDFSHYAEVVGFALKDPVVGGSQECVDLVRNGTQTLAQLVLERDLTKLPLQPCDNGADILNNLLDQSTYYSNIYGNFQGVVQYNLEGSKPVVADLCDTITAEKTGIAALTAVTKLFFDDCIPSNFQKDYVDAYLTDTAFSPEDCNLNCKSDRQWIWQSCNDYGYFQTTSSDPVLTLSPFAFGQALNIETAGIAICAAAYNITTYSTPRSDDSGLRANSVYGARHFTAANVTFVNGDVDPWHSLSIINSTDPFYQAGDNDQYTGPRVSVVELHGTAHCRDMYAPGAFEGSGIHDTPDVEWAHNKIANDIHRYLQ